MKNFTIALFAIMMIAGFAMADETANVLVSATVQAHSTMVVTIPSGEASLLYTLEGGADTEIDYFDVYAESNYANVTVTYGFTPVGTWAGLSYTDFVGVSDPVTTGVGGITFNKEFSITSNLDAIADTYAGTILVTLNQ